MKNVSFLPILVSASVLCSCSMTDTTQTVADQKREIDYLHRQAGDLHRQLQSLAVCFNVPEENISQMSDNELISEIRLQIKTTERCSVKTLTKSEIKLLGDYLDVEADILKKILDNDKYLQSLQGKKFLVLPENR